MFQIRFLCLVLALMCLVGMCGGVLAADERRIPVRLRGAADRCERQVRAERDDAGETRDAQRAALLPGAGDSQ